MRDKKWKNYYETLDTAKSIGILVNVKPKDILHILRLEYLIRMHKLSNIVLDSDSKIREVGIEIPYYGKLNLKIENNKVSMSSFEPEDELVDDLINVVSTGESLLINEARKSVGNRIVKRYRELL